MIKKQTKREKDLQEQVFKLERENRTLDVLLNTHFNKINAACHQINRMDQQLQEMISFIWNYHTKVAKVKK